MLTTQTYPLPIYFPHLSSASCAPLLPTDLRARPPTVRCARKWRSRPPLYECVGRWEHGQQGHLFLRPCRSPDQAVSDKILSIMKPFGTGNLPPEGDVQYQ